jgi:hypothetical protein
MTKIFAIPVFAAVLFAAGCASGGHERAGVAVAGGDFYDGYYDGFYGQFNDGYWGDDGAFWYSDTGHAWHRDEGKHFQRMAGGSNFSHIHGSGIHREH